MSADGNWKITLKTPMGPEEMQLSVVTAGETFKGTVTGRMGENVVDGQITGDTLTWSEDITQPMPMTLQFKAVVKGDDMTGDVKLGSFGTASLTGVRAG